MDYSNILIVLICFVSSDANENRQHLPTYFHLVNEPYFIDKTDILRFLFEAYVNVSFTPIFYISCPHGFGKRTSLMMIKAFAQLEVDYDTTYIKPWVRTTAASFFRHLKIARYTNLIIKHLAQHPVIHINFRIPRTGIIRSVDRFLNDVLLECIHEYSWLASHLGYNLGEEPPQREWFEKKDAFEDTYCKVFGVERDHVLKYMHIFREDLSIDDLEMALYYVGKVLYNFFGKNKVILLVENFQNIALHSFATCRLIGQKLYQSINSMLENALGGTNCFEFAVITSTGGIASTLLKTYDFLDNHPFTNYYGFLEQDLLLLFSRYNISKEFQNEIFRYGYLTSAREITIYQPSTTIDMIMDIFQYGRILPNPHYQWTDPNWHRLLVSLFHISYEFADKINKLLQEGSFTYRISKQMIRGAFPEFLKACSKNFIRNENDTTVRKQTMNDAVFNLCFGLGYLCHSPDGNYDSYTVPNPGVRELLQSALNKWARSFSTISAYDV